MNWLEYFKAALREERVSLLRSALREKLTLSQNGRLGVLQIGPVRDLAESPATESVRVARHWSEEDPSHAGVHVDSKHEVAAAVVLANLVEEAFRAGV